MSAGIVIVGAGLSGQRCCEALRARGWDGAIRLVGDEQHRPYDRPPLSKGLLAGTTAVGDVALRPSGWHDEHGVELVLGARATGLDPGRRQLLLAAGARVRYDQLVVATGAALGDRYNVGTHGGDRALIAITTLITMLTLLIIAVAGLGVLNTVALQIRERAHDIGVFKALGMTPRQALAMVVCSVAVTGLDGPRGQLGSPGLCRRGVLAAGDDRPGPGGPGHRGRRRPGARDMGRPFPHRRGPAYRITPRTE